MNLYRNESSYPKPNAQRNLSGRTHYVDDDTLRFHKSRILSTHITDNGLLFALIESMALDMHNRARGYRYVIFDLLGHVIDRPKLEESFKSSRQASKAMWAALNKIDAKAVNMTAIDQAQKHHAEEMAELTLLVQNIGNEKAA